MNTLSPAAQAAIRRVKILQVFSARSGFATKAEQLETLLALNNEDLIAVAAVLPNIHEGVSNGNPRR